MVWKEIIELTNCDENMWLNLEGHRWLFNFKAKITAKILKAI